MSSTKVPYHVTFDLDLDLSTPWMRADVLTILCNFGRDRAVCVVVEASCAKSLQTDGRTKRQTDKRQTPRDCIRAKAEFILSSEKKCRKLLGGVSRAK